MHKYSSNNICFPNYAEHFQCNFYSNMLLLLCFCLPPAACEHLAATGPSTPLTLCLDFCARSPDESEGSGSSYGDTLEKSDSNESSRGDMPEESESESESESECDDLPDNAESPATSRKKGSFNWDREKGGFNLEWANLAEFDMWRRIEESTCSIQFITSTSRKGGIHSGQKKIYVCSREYFGGGTTYEKKYPKRHRKIGTNKTGCGCRITIKQYHHTPTVLGRYAAKHDHEIGTANIAYTRLSGTAQEQIKDMLTQKIDRRQIVSSHTQNGLATNPNIFEGTRDSPVRA